MGMFDDSGDMDGRLVIPPLASWLYFVICVKDILQYPGSTVQSIVDFSANPDTIA